MMHEGHAAAAKWDQLGAITAFSQALQLDKDSVPARVNLGLAQLLNNQFAESAGTLHPLTRREPVSEQVLYLHGLALLKDGRSEEAIEPLRRTAESTPTDASLLFQYGVALQEAKRADDAADVYRRVMELERFHITAPFRLARLERMAGRSEEADRLLVISERNRTVLGAEAADREARGLNRFTKPMDPPSEWQPTPEAVGFKLVDVTDEWGLSGKPEKGLGDTRCRVALIDVGNDGTVELLGQFEGGWTLVRFERERFEPVHAEFRVDRIDGLTVPAVADYDNDGLADVFWAGTPHSLLLRQVEVGKFADSTSLGGLGELSSNAGVWIDWDHDGDTDLVVEAGDGPLQFFRNRGDGTFFDDSATIVLPDDINPSNGIPRERSTPVAAGDFNDDDATDLAIFSQSGSRVLLNKGSSAFSSQVLLQRRGEYVALPFGFDDVNNDGRLDVASDVIVDRESSARNIQFTDSTIKPIILNYTDFFLGQLWDADGDGFLDVIAIDKHGLQLWRNMGHQGWRDISAECGLHSINQRGEWKTVNQGLIPADIDSDGDLDLLGAALGMPVRALRNDRSKPAKNLRLSLEGTKSNRSAVGARVDIRSGKTRILRNVTSQPMMIGVGEFEKLDLVKILWTTGATDALADVRVDKPLHVVETTVTLGSCPHLYVWNGGFRFVTDILGNSPLGLPYAPGKYIPADTSEIVWLGDESGVTIVDDGQQLERERELGGGGAVPSNNLPLLTTSRAEANSQMAMDALPDSQRGADVSDTERRRRSVVVEITDELRELLYLDEARLLVVDHPGDVEVHSNDRVISPPFPPSEVWAVRNAKAPQRAIDEQGENVAARVAHKDEVRVGPRKLRSAQFKGLAEATTLTLDFGPIDVNALNVLVLNGWLHWGGASSNIAAAQNPQVGNSFPRIEVMTPDGVWLPVDVVVGAPAGKSKTILVDLAGGLPKGSSMFRLHWGLELYWDRIALAQRAETPKASVFHPASATLYYHGVPRMTRRSPDRPFLPTYDDLLESPPWRLIPEGYCTRYGDVIDLLLATDDRYVIMNCGDSCRIQFDVAGLPVRPDNWVRQYFLYTDGWDKDMDHNVFTGSTVTPLPWHGQDVQRYGLDSHSPLNEQWMEEYNTRWVPGDRLQR